MNKSIGLSVNNLEEMYFRVLNVKVNKVLIITNSINLHVIKIINLWSAHAFHHNKSRYVDPTTRVRTKTPYKRMLQFGFLVAVKVYMAI